MQSKHTLTVSRRDRIGSRYARRDRAAGLLPAVLYGHGKEPVALALDAVEAIRCFESGERVFTIEVKEEGAQQTVLLKDIQFDYLGTNPVHVDLARVDLNEEVEAHVSINFVGEAVGLKTAGAILTHPASSITIRCTVANLPEHVDVDISNLAVGESMHASEVKLPEGLVLVSDDDAVVASITVKKAEEEETAGTEGEDVGAQSAETEVITEKKDDAEADKE